MQKGHASAAAFQAHPTPNLHTGVSGGFLLGLQEPPAYKGKIVGFGSFQKLIYGNKNGDPRVAIYASRSLHIWPMMGFCDRDTAVGLWETGTNNIKNIVVVSVYMDILLQGVWPAVFVLLLEYCVRKNKEVLICGDTNSWSTLWGSREMNKRGEALEDLIFSKNITKKKALNRPLLHAGGRHLRSTSQWRRGKPQI